MSNNKQNKRSTLRKSATAPDTTLEDPLTQQAEPLFHGLPDELILKVFSHLASVRSSLEEEDDVDMTAMLDCFIKAAPAQHAGLRQFPFLGQVCKRWRDLLEHSASHGVLWREVVVDFGHELVTAVHRPVKWSDARPPDEEFKSVFAQTRISSQRVLNFVAKRHTAVRRLVLLNSEGYWSDEHDFVSLRHKHNFGPSSFGVMVCLVREYLEELCVQQCNNLFPTGSDSLDAISCCATSLRCLHLLDLHSHVSSAALAGLSSLTRTHLEELTVESRTANSDRVLIGPVGFVHMQLEELTVGTGTTTSDWALIGPVGITALPEPWRGLRRLRRLGLRGHNLLRSLPDWLAQMQLESLELSLCRNVVNLEIVSHLRSLDTLVLQGMALTLGPRTGSQLHSGQMPRLSDLTRLTSLCLADNCLTQLPPLAVLKNLVCLDVSGNAALQITSPLTPLLTALPQLRLVDLRQIHEERDNCWSDAKCASMSHVAALAKSIKRRRPPGLVKFCSH